MKYKKYITASFLVSVAIYLIVSFIYWDILWIAKIEWNNERRGLVVLITSAKELMFSFVVGVIRITNHKFLK